MNTLDERKAPEVNSEASADAERDRARKRVQDRRDFGSHLVAYVVINAFLVLVWAFTGAGHFWPVWVLAAWGVGLVLHAWETFVRRPITEADIDAALRRQVAVAAGLPSTRSGPSTRAEPHGRFVRSSRGAEPAPSSQGRNP